MVNFINLDEPMGPGFLIFFKKVKQSSDRLNVISPDWLHGRIDCEDIECPIDDFPKIEEIRKKVEKFSRNAEVVQVAVRSLLRSKYTPVEIKELIYSHDFVNEVVEPKFDSVQVLSILMEWYLFINVCMDDDEDAILVLMIS